MRYCLVFSVVQIVLGTSYNVVKVSVVLFLPRIQSNVHKWPPKCKELVITDGSLLLTEIDPQWFSSKKKSLLSRISTILFQSNTCMCCYMSLKILCIL